MISYNNSKLSDGYKTNLQFRFKFRYGVINYVLDKQKQRVWFTNANSGRMFLNGNINKNKGRNSKTICRQLQNLLRKLT